MRKTDAKKIVRSSKTSVSTETQDQPPGFSKDENRINRIALNDNMSFTLGQSAKKLFSFKVRF